MIDVSTKSILLFDCSGSYTFAAERLAQDFGSVKYFTQWESGFSTVADILPGMGLPDVERVAEFFTALESVDCVLFCDVTHGDLQEWLRKEGWPVFGCGHAQVLERDRALLKRVLRHAGMSTANDRIVTGVDDLAKILQKEKDLYVKMSFFRGAMESYHHKQWFSSETWLHNLAVTLGPYAAIAEFLVEEPIEGESVEIGADLYAVEGKIPDNYLCGYEIKDAAFIGTTDGVPARLAKNTEEFATILKAYGYSGIFSTECKVTEDDCYLIDATCRLPSPPSELECKLLANISQVIWEGAHGRLIEPEYTRKYGAQLILKSDWIVEHPLALKIGEPDNVFIHGHFRIEGNDYAVVPEEFAEFGGAVGIGDTLADAVGECIDAAQSVDGHQVRYDVKALDEAMDTIKKGEELGLEWFPARRLKTVGG